MSKNIIKLKEMELLPHQQLRIATLNLLHNTIQVEKRFELLYEELNIIQPDILHVQEANFTHSAKFVKNILTYCGFKDMGKTRDIKAQRTDFTSSNTTFVKDKAIFSELPMCLEAEQSQHVLPTLLTETVFNGIPVYTFNVHGVWGSYNEPSRLKQMVQIEEQAKMIHAIKPEAVIILAGDLNALPESPTINYLTGNYIVNDSNALWTDAWKNRGTGHNAVTSEMAGILNENTAEDVGIKFPSLVPSRRIDYIMTRNLRFGMPGVPLTFNRFADTVYKDGLTISDHYGLYADLLIG